MIAALILAIQSFPSSLANERRVTKKDGQTWRGGIRKERKEGGRDEKEEEEEEEREERTEEENESAL